jgi:hypothetical protein
MLQKPKNSQNIPKVFAILYLENKQFQQKSGLKNIHRVKHNPYWSKEIYTWAVCGGSSKTKYKKSSRLPIFPSILRHCK